MSKREILVTPFGEMMDMISCLSVYNGIAEQTVKKVWKFEDAIELR